jgi:hypothetical protein
LTLHAGLTVDYVKKQGAGVILRGLRAVTDFEYELVMANMNKKLAPDIETMIVFASPEFYYVSSNTVKEVAFHGGKVTDLVPANVHSCDAEKIWSEIRQRYGPQCGGILHERTHRLGLANTDIATGKSRQALKGLADPAARRARWGNEGGRQRRDLACPLASRIGARFDKD